MKLKLLTVALTFQNGETRQYSTSEMVEHIARNGREFGQSRDADKIAQGVRLIAACKGRSELSAEIDSADAEALKAAIKNPSCGWFSGTVEVQVPIGIDRASNSVIKRAIDQRAIVSGVDLHPLIEGVLRS